MYRHSLAALYQLLFLIKHLHQKLLLQKQLMQIQPSSLTSKGVCTRVDSSQALGGAKVRDLQHTTVGVHKHIVSLDVSMHYLVVMLLIKSCILNLFFYIINMRQRSLESCWLW